MRRRPSAAISDPSGICFLGGPGRQLTLFVDATGSDVGDYFSYLQGSTTEGLLECGTGSLSVGEHRLILWSFDGVGNGSSDTLLVSVREEGSVSISEALVYPNPGNGLRCFSFRLSEDAAVRVSIHTIAGRCIRTIDAQCSQGYNQILWDGMDADGDEPATGAYIYFIGAVTTGTSSFESETGLSGVLAVVR
ncbi:MAG TPA: FlgD immunoglobulin-like domain containing protein [Candidatus Fermentibacter sp.]|nr:FlgD immunoglobulin-like domain containing protein [Candidatus Fermentibacter sp.]